MNYSHASRLAILAGTSLAALSVAAPALAGELAGTVSDSSETRALQAAEVTIVELGRTAVTARDGSFRFGDVPAGEYTVVTRYVGVEADSATVSVPDQGVRTVRILLGGVNADEIIVIGQSANQASALSRKKAADGVESVLTRDAIGQFPDQNVAESLRRLPGLNILNDQGEGRFVSVRGLDPDLNATSLNGVRLPSPESDVRSVALDVISSDIIESIEVKKSLTPDMDGDTIGASIEIKTTSVFDRKKDLYSVKAEGSYNDYADYVSPKGSLDFATRLTDTFGVAGGFSYYKRKFETDNIEAENWNVENDAGILFAEDIEYRDYDVERERISGHLSFDLKATEDLSLFLRGNYSQFDDQEYRRRTTFDFGDFDDDGPDGGSDTSAVFGDGNQPYTVERDIKDRFESQKIRSVVFGGDVDTGEWTSNFLASWAKSSEYENGSLDPTQFEREFEGEGAEVTFDYSDRRVPGFAVTSDPGDFFDPSTYELNDIEVTTLSDATDEEFALKWDLAREFVTDSGIFTVQGGFKQRWRTKIYDKNVEFYENDDFTLADVLGEQTYRIQDIGPVASDTGATDYFYANVDAFELQEIDSMFDSAAEDYEVQEDILAGYLLGRWDNSILRVIGGVRVERTHNDIFGNIVELVEEGASYNGAVLDDDMVFVTPTSVEKNYTDWLPSLTLRYSPQPELVFRAAASKSLVRPKLSRLAPRFIIEENDENEREGEFGNPDLKPYEAWNFDVSAEYYFSGNGGITLGGFYKDVKNFFADIEYDADDAPFNGVYRGIAFDEAVIPLNGDSAEIYGIEASYSQLFTMLPAPLDGLLLNANYTYTDATGTLDGREIPLPSSSKHTFNLALGYEKGPVSLRAAGTYRSKYLDEAAPDADEDRYVDKHFQLDLSAKFRVTQGVRLFAEWVNVNDARYFAYQNFASGKRLYQYERYGSTVKFGVSANF